MAEKKKRIVKIEDLFARTKVRYNRANLTVDQWVSVHLTPIESALKDHRQGKASAEDVAWAFVKEQVTGHTPSFKWADADLDKLLPRIIAVTKEPKKLKALTPAELVPELEALEKRERERWEKVNQELRKTLAPRLARDVSALQSALKASQAFSNISGLDSVQRVSREFSKSLQPETANTLQRLNKEVAKSMRPPAAEALKALQPQLKALENVRLDWEKINKKILPQIPPATLGIDFKAYEDLLGTSISRDLLKNEQLLDQWQILASQVKAAASEADLQDIAEVVESTTNEATIRDGDIDLSSLTDRLEEISEEVKKDPKNSAVRTILLAVAGNLIAYFIKIILAAKYGLDLNP